MTDPQLHLLETFEALAEEAPHDPDLAATARARAGRRWPAPWTAVAAAAAAVVLAATLVVLTRDTQREQPGPATDDTSDTSETEAYDCPASLTPSVLPAWARSGFSERRPRMPNVLGTGGDIIAIVFGDPLVSPPARDRSNKILWVVREDPGPLTIRATRSPTDDPVVLEVTTGPSVVDLPDVGCWHLELSWGDRSDSLDLRYR